MTSVQKLFNGQTKFLLNNVSIAVNTLVMDDAHACADRIRETCHIRIPRDEPGLATQSTKTHRQALSRSSGDDLYILCTRTGRLVLSKTHKPLIWKEVLNTYSVSTASVSSRNPPACFYLPAGILARSLILAARWLFLGAATQDVGAISLPKARSNRAPISFLSALSP